MEWFVLGGTWNLTLFHPPALGRDFSHQSRLSNIPGEPGWRDTKEGDSIAEWAWKEDVKTKSIRIYCSILIRIQASTSSQRGRWGAFTILFVCFAIQLPWWVTMNSQTTDYWVFDDDLFNLSPEWIYLMSWFFYWICCGIGCIQCFLTSY